MCKYKFFMVLHRRTDPPLTEARPPQLDEECIGIKMQEVNNEKTD